MYCEKDSNNRTRNRGNLLVWCLIFALMAAIAIGDAEQVAATGGASESGQSEIEAIGSEELYTVSRHSFRSGRPRLFLHYWRFIKKA